MIFDLDGQTDVLIRRLISAGGVVMSATTEDVAVLENQYAGVLPAVQAVKLGPPKAFDRRKFAFCLCRGATLSTSTSGASWHPRMPT